MKTLLLPLLFLSAAPVQAQGADEGEDRVIVVTGTSLSDARKRLNDCIARNCPPLEDIAATLAYAEILFVDGDYPTARSVLRQSLGRNRDAAAQYPHAVAGLYRAHSRVSIHLGEGDDYRQSSYGAVRALKKGLSEDDMAVIAAQLDVADMHVRLREIPSAERLLRQVSRDATAIGAKELAATAELRLAYLQYRTQRSEKALDRLREIAGSSDPAARMSRLAAMLILARLDREEGKTASSDALVAELAKLGVERPTLLYAPPIEIPTAGVGTQRDGLTTVNQTQMLPTDDFEKKWADVGFWVRPDGAVDEVEILRSSGDEKWIDPVLRSIKGRVYAASKDRSPNYRVERYTYTSLLVRRTDSRIPQRSPQGRIEYIDLTAEEGQQRGS